MSKKGKKGGPKVRQEPLEKKTPRISPDTSPESFMNKKPVWRLGIMDFEGPWSWKKINRISLLETIHEKLKNFETMTWAEIEGPKHHLSSVSKFCKKAKDRLTTIKLDDYDVLFSFRLTGEKRVWGIRENEVLKILWWDPKHEVCPAPKRYT